MIRSVLQSCYLACWAPCGPKIWQHRSSGTIHCHSHVARFLDLWEPGRLASVVLCVRSNRGLGWYWTCSGCQLNYRLVVPFSFHSSIHFPQVGSSIPQNDPIYKRCLLSDSFKKITHFIGLSHHHKILFRHRYCN